MQEIIKAMEAFAKRCMEQGERIANTTCRDIICEKCGKVTLTTDDRGYTTAFACDCTKVFAARKLLEQSGLARAVEVMTFGTYRVQETWQQSALQMAQEWTWAVTDGKVPWLFFGGQPGSGKTHLCTAACGELLNKGIEVRYVLWAEIARQLKACVNDCEMFDQLMSPLKKAQVLYIDDLFKTRRGDQRSILEVITPADVRVAFEIIDARVRMNRPTIISTEWMLDELVEADEATFSRVNHMSDGYQVQIARKVGRNWRMKGAV